LLKCIPDGNDLSFPSPVHRVGTDHLDLSSFPIDYFSKTNDPCPYSAHRSRSLFESAIENGGNGLFEITVASSIDYVW